VVLVQREDPAALREAAAMAASATSLGVEVFLVWFGPALEALVHGRLEEPAAGAGAGAAALLEEARETGRLRHLACSAAAVSSPLGADAVRQKVDDIVGWPTVIGLMRAAEKAFVW
jgi:predicted peroxiredoxin